MKTSRAAIVGGAVADARLYARMGNSAVGRVAGLFSSGFYVEMEDALFAVTGPAIHPGPVHLILHSPPPRPNENEAVHFTRDALRVGPFTIGLSEARQYAPTLPTPGELCDILPVVAELRHAFPIPAELARVAADLEHAIAAGDLETARVKLQGRGSGLTPAGDDVLAGLLLLACWRDPSDPEPCRISAGAATTRLSRTFLQWAALGQSIEPVHQMLEAARRMTGPGARVGHERLRFDAVVAALAQVGASSGKALLAGLSLAAYCACKSSDVPENRSTASRRGPFHPEAG